MENKKLKQLLHECWIQAQRKAFDPLTEKGFKTFCDEHLQTIKEPEEKHYFTPSDNNMFCAKCDKYLTDNIHIKEPEENETFNKLMGNPLEQIQDIKIIK